MVQHGSAVLKCTVCGRKRRRVMTKLNDHHITYDEPPWEVELTGQQHRVLTVIQNTKSSGEQYARLTNFMHSL